jgi:hypothetical protein
MGILTFSAHVRKLGPTLLTGNRLVAGICLKGVTHLIRLVMERGFVGLEWGLEGLVPNRLCGNCHAVIIRSPKIETNDINIQESNAILALGVGYQAIA